MKETKKEQIEDLQRENEWLRIEIKEKRRDCYFWVGLFFFLFIFFWIIGTQKGNLQEENALLKSQITTWDLNIHCDMNEEQLGVSGTSDFNVEFKDYESYKVYKEEFLNNLKQSDEFKDCEIK